MALPLVGIRERLNQLLNSIVAPAEVEVCEGARLLLAECLLTAAFKPEVLTEELLRRIGIAFCLSAVSTRSYYRENIVDRWNDFLVLQRAGVLGGSHGERSRPAILLFHVVARNLRREFLRESVQPVDARRGWLQLRHLSFACKAVYDHVGDQELIGTPYWAAVSPSWEPIGAVLTAIIDMTEAQSQTKAYVREQASQKMSEVYERLEETARVIHVPILAPHTPVLWSDELAVAAGSCFALPLPERGGLPRAEELIWPTVVEEQPPSVPLAGPFDQAVGKDVPLEDDLRAAIQCLGPQSAAEIEYLREDLRLQRDYPGQYVAYIDAWDSVGDVRRLVRQVLAAGNNEVDLEERLAQRLAAQPIPLKARIEKALVDDLNAGIPDRFDFASES